MFGWYIFELVKEAWNTVKESQDKREKIQALSLAKDCYGMKLELLTNATVVEMRLGLFQLMEIKTKLLK